MFEKKEKSEKVTEETVDEKVSEPVHTVTDDDRGDVKRKEWRPYYDEQLKKLIDEMEQRYRSPLDKDVIKKLENAAKVCAKNRVIMDKKYGKK